jgi:ABC-type branched-subunit amino acid transport system permease subunit
LEAVAPAGFVLVCIVAGVQLGSYLQYVVAISLVSAMVGVALVVLVGLARCITLASASIMAIGAYASTLSVTAGLPYVLSVFVALIFGALAGWL